MNRDPWYELVDFVEQHGGSLSGEGNQQLYEAVERVIEERISRLPAPSESTPEPEQKFGYAVPPLMASDLPALWAEIQSLRSSLATAREDVLREALAMIDVEISESDTTGFGGGLRSARRFLRSLSTEGGEE